MVVDLNYAAAATGAANLEYGCASHFPAPRASQPALPILDLNNGRLPESGHHRIPMPSPSRKILGSLDRSNMHMSFLGRSGNTPDWPNHLCQVEHTGTARPK